MKWFDTLKSFVVNNIVGITLGGVGGFLIARYFPDLVLQQSVSQTQSFIDPLVASGKSAVSVAMSKIEIVYSVVGMIFGGFIEQFWRTRR